MKKIAQILFLTPLLAEPDPIMLEEVTVYAEAEIEEEELNTKSTGSRKLDREQIETLGDASGDPNELLEILPNTQFDNRRYRLNADSAGDLSPADVSISGGRPTENNFILDGISANNQLDTVSQRSFDNTVGSTQSLYLDADLLKTFEAYDSNVPAEYGQFLGGVVKAETRDPEDEFKFSFSTQYSTSDWVQYLIAPEDISDPLPGTTEFTRIQNRVSFDIPLTDRISALLAYTRAEAQVTRGALSSAYFSGARPRDTIKENTMLKFRFEQDETSTWTLQSFLTPYENQYFRTNVARQFGGGSSTKLRWEKDLNNSSLDFNLAYNTTENSREEDPNHFIYSNTASIDWIADTRNSGSFGGFGNLDVTQENIQLDAKQRFEFENANFSYGLQAAQVSATRSRPQTNFGYRGAVETFGRPISGGDPTDGTIIQNEQFLTERNDYRAFTADAEIMQLRIFADYNHTFDPFDWLTIVPSLGLRYEYDDFLENHNIAPRTSLRFDHPSGVSITGGFNRYYGKNQLAYALREQNPDSYVYRRNFNFDGNEFVLDDFELFSQRRFTSFAGSDLNTPHSDELSLALTLPVSLVDYDFGTFRIKGIQRDNKDSFARSEPIPTTDTNELGEEFTFDRYELTNRGSSKYRSLSLEWSKQWNNHRFSASTTLSENNIAPGTDTIFSNTQLELENEQVFYNGGLIDYRDLDVQRSNFNVPLYISFGWTSTWLDDRLRIGMRGRFRDAYTTINDTGDTVDASGNPGGGFELYEDLELKSQFIVDSTISYTWETETFGDIALDLKIDNLFNSRPNVPVSRLNPYQAGRAFSVAAKFTF